MNKTKKFTEVSRDTDAGRVVLSGACGHQMEYSSLLWDININPPACNVCCPPPTYEDLFGTELDQADDSFRDLVVSWLIKFYGLSKEEAEKEARR